MKTWHYFAVKSALLFAVQEPSFLVAAVVCAVFVPFVRKWEV